MYIVSLRTLSYASKFKCYVETTQQRPQRVATECLLGHGLAQPRARLLARVARREGGEPQEALATRAEAGARDGDDLRRLEQLVRVRVKVRVRLRVRVRVRVRTLTLTPTLTLTSENMSHELLPSRSTKT